MISNNPFPYNVTITRDILVEGSSIQRKILYDGKCDFDLATPTLRDGVLLGKYRLYIPPKAISEDATPIEKLDQVMIFLRGRRLYGEVTEVFPSNLGTTVLWDNQNN